MFEILLKYSDLGFFQHLVDYFLCWRNLPETILCYVHALFGPFAHSRIYATFERFDHLLRHLY